MSTIERAWRLAYEAFLAAPGDRSFLVWLYYHPLHVGLELPANLRHPHRPITKNDLIPSKKQGQKNILDQAP
ncbi:MAG TPA: hypothetical protein PK156_48565 [Polyangium sp.]|nr:hypothetical protein [Polyangium sp.]